MKSFLKCLPLLLALLLTVTACAGDMTASSETEETTGGASGNTQVTTGSNAANNGDTPSVQGTLKEIYDRFMKNVDAELPSLVETPVDRENFQYYYGISDASVAESTFVSEPMMGAIPFGISLMRVKDGQDASAIAAQMKKGVDPRRWVCVTASYVETAVKGDLIILVLDNDNARGAKIIEAFSKQ